ncbi:MAG: flagellar hook-length control protein FliK [Synergistales bacterium]|nr:flagellar hook-length control protein FliK [Synergistales bacterium]
MPYGINGASSGQIQPTQQQGIAGRQTQQAGATARGKPNIPNGALVKGVVVSAEGNNAYTVRVAGYTLKAMANLPLAAGQRFQAVWDATTAPPLLRLRSEDLALLARFTGQSREVASSLLSRGLPLSEGVMKQIQQAWTRLGGQPQTLGSLVELWARSLPLTERNVQLVGWYLQLDGQKAQSLWKRARSLIRKRIAAGERFSLKELAAEDPEVGEFLEAHGMLSRPSREGVDPSLLAPAWWPIREDFTELAKISAHVEEYEGKKIWRVHFDIDGVALGTVEGEVSGDGEKMNAGLRTEGAWAASVLRSRLSELDSELRELGLPVSSLGVGETGGSGKRGQLSRYPHIDMEI